MLFWSWLSPSGCLDCVPKHKNHILLIWSCLCSVDFRAEFGTGFVPCLWMNLDSIGVGLLTGERVVSEISLGR